MKKASTIIALACILFQSCITIKQSSLDLPYPESIKAGECEISSTGPVHMNILGLIRTDFMSAGVMIRYGDLVLFADPVAVGNTVKADYIFITHNHKDHFSIPDIRKLSKPGTIVVGPAGVTKKLKEYTCRTAFIGDNPDFGNVKCTVVESYNLNSGIHKKGSNFVGYVISCDSTRIYIAGDTDFIPEMNDLKNITVAILPIGVGKTAMDPLSAAKATNLIRPEIVIPVHYELQQNSEKEFIEGVDKNIEVRLFFSTE